MPTRIFAAFIVPLLLANSASAQVLHGPVTNPTNGHVYYLLQAGSWQESQGRAVLFGGNLATVNDQAENDWIFTTFGLFGGQDRSLWIGLNDISAEGNFVWADGNTSTYRNWLPLQPDQALGNEDYVHIVRSGNGFGHPGGFWNDLDSPSSPFTEFDPIHGVVEVVPEPAAWVLMGVAGCALAIGFGPCIAMHQSVKGGCLPARVLPAQGHEAE